MSILTMPTRLRHMLIDAHESIVGAYEWTQESVDQIHRPCWLIFVEDASYPAETVDQEQVQQSYSLAYIGEPYNAGYLDSSGYEFELQAREVAVATIDYLLSHPQAQVSDNRGLQGGVLGALDSIMNIKVDGRSAITLFGRDGINDAFWGFTIDITVTEQLIYETVGY